MKHDNPPQNLPPHVQRFLASDKKHAKTPTEQAFEELDEQLALAKQKVADIERLQQQIARLEQARAETKQARPAKKSKNTLKTVGIFAFLYWLFS